MKTLKIISGFIASFLILMASFLAIYANNNWDDKLSDKVGLIYGAVLIASVLVFAFTYAFDEDRL